jgi:hypothetical protein
MAALLFSAERKKPPSHRVGFQFAERTADSKDDQTQRARNGHDACASNQGRDP